MFFSYKESAFTLFEFMICIAVLAIIVTIAIPSYHNLNEKREVNHVYPLLKQHVDFAKNTALTYHSDIVICASEDLNTCQNNMWHKGIIIFSDTNKNKRLDLNETVFSKIFTDIKYGQLKWNGSASNTNTLTFQGDTGLTRGSMGAFHYCNFKHSEYNKHFPIGMMGNLKKEPNAVC
ncbi:GspH/FimT family pseudopilin [Acinetobacter silvestris]|uniref:Type II secretion system protein H n=1 Tax=Acinetobacter silvestris TaxID=1977882 RepID=A0A1Y3CMA2_9GAMM|nr:GspH/FimT family pseudopilin [Acinetobacter silvestris]OTG67317.1 hypothetical protein B9T28_01420 [Acinetobacter silvestris]